MVLKKQLVNYWLNIPELYSDAILLVISFCYFNNKKFIVF